MRRTALLIDVDPVRPSGTSSTDKQMTAALDTATRIRNRLSSLKWPEPLECMSGNGAYLIYRIDLPNDDGSTQLVQNCLLTLAQQYSDTETDVDTTTFNAGRICKVLGTMARKGDHVVGVPGVDDMPHRRSYFIEPRQSLQCVPSKLLNELAAQFEPPETTATGNGSRFDLEQWLRSHHVPVGRAQTYSGGQKWLFDELPLPCKVHPGKHDHDRTGFIIRRADGVIQAGCRHQRCTWNWRDLRLLYEPDAYDYKL